MNVITVNGQSFLVNGSNICVSNGTVMVDGKVITSELSGTVEIKFEGDIASLDVRQGSATIRGSVKGDVDAGGSIQCGNVLGDVDAGGSVQCGNIGGDIDAGGSVTYRK